MDTVTLLAVGDVMLARGVGTKINKHGFSYPFAHVAPTLARGDLRVCNLESPLSQQGRPIPYKNVYFRAHPGAVNTLKHAGFDIVTLANNHMYDYGAHALCDTLYYLERAGILHVGAGANTTEARRSLIVNCKGYKLGFLAYCVACEATTRGDRAGVALRWLPDMISDITALRPQVDWIIVSLHQGFEYVPYPLPEHVSECRRLIDSGADIILGHHPHVLQGIESYNGGVIAYSLGNFVFDDVESVDASRESMILELSLYPGHSIAYRIIPTYINDNYQPEVVTGTIATKILSHVGEISTVLAEPGSLKEAWDQSGAVVAAIQLPVLLAQLRKHGFLYLWSKIRRIRTVHLRFLVSYLRHAVHTLMKKS